MSHTLGQVCDAHGSVIIGPRPACPNCPDEREFMRVSCRYGCPEWVAS